MARHVVIAALTGFAVLLASTAAFRVHVNEFQCIHELWAEVPASRSLAQEPVVSQAGLDAVLGAAARYKNYASRVTGWSPNIHLGFVSRLAHFQLQKGFTGSVGEIGTYYGKYFWAITSAALPEERKVAIDIFENQKLNVDNSGFFVNKTRFLEHAANMDVKDLVLLSQESSTVHVKTFAAKHIPAFRFFSVDGGHTVEATLKDLQLAACSIRRGGVIVLDDWSNLDWTGVTDGSFLFMHSTSDIVPFLYMCNKLYFTTHEHHEMYYNYVMSQKCFQCTASKQDPPYHESRYQLAGTKVCIVVNADCNSWCLD